MQQLHNCRLNVTKNCLKQALSKGSHSLNSPLFFINFSFFKIKMCLIEINFEIHLPVKNPAWSSF